VAHISRSARAKSKGELGAQRDTWKNFLDENPGELVCYQSIIPFKRPEKIEEHIRKAIKHEYGAGEYDLFRKNCEHFATMCVYGFPYSKQANLVKFNMEALTSYFRRMENTNEFFTELTTWASCP